MKLVLVVLLLPLLLLIAVKAAVPRYLPGRVSAFISENCETCEFTAEASSLRLIPPQVRFDGIRFRQGDAAETSFDVLAPSLTIDFEAGPLFRKELRIKALQFREPEVRVEEGDKKVKTGKRGAGSSEWKFLVGSTQVRNAKFSYTRIHNKKRAVIRIREIEVDIGPWGNLESVKDTVTESQAKGILEKNGKFTLSVTAKVFRGPLYANIVLSMRAFHLAEVNGYFMPADGVQLEGTLQEGRSEIRLRDRTLRGEVFAVYKDLDLQFHKTEERGSFASAFGNFSEEIGIRSENTSESSRKVRRTKLERQPDEAVTHLVFRGMGNAAMRLIKSARD